MKLSINLALDNAAFVNEGYTTNDTTLDVDAIFKAVRKAINQIDELAPVDQLSNFWVNVKDTNGNTVGRLTITD